MKLTLKKISIIFFFGGVLSCGGPRPEICDNGRDDDRNGFRDCEDVFCSLEPACQEICDSGIDEDFDGFIDCLDLNSCITALNCQEITNCSDEIDNDQDGAVDCEDADCNNDPVCDEICDNGEDEDVDGFIDCEDVDCANDPSCQENCDNGIDDDEDSLIDCQDIDCNDAPNCLESGNCQDGLDNDGDNAVDCQDQDCDTDPACKNSVSDCQTPFIGPDPSIQSGDTTNAPNLSNSSCQFAGGSDIVFQVVPSNSGLLNLSITSNANLGIFVQTLCGDSATEIACVDNVSGPNAEETLLVSVTENEPVFVFVGGFQSGEEGSFTLGITSGVEFVCDDGLDDDNDGFIDCKDADCLFNISCL